MILSSKKIVNKILIGLREEVKKWPVLSVSLAVILIGNNPASLSFIKQKEKAAKQLGIKFKLHKFNKNIKQTELLAKIKEIGQNKELTGMLVQLPVPSYLEKAKILKAIPANKDVDALTGKKTSLVSPVVSAIIRLLKEYKITIRGKKVVIVGQGDLIGKPLALVVKELGAQLTTCDIETSNLKQKTLKADIIISCTGHPCLIKKDMIKRGVVIIDAGFKRMRMTDGKYQIVGDVDFENVKEKAKAVSPATGGIGPLTVAMLMTNLIELKKNN